MRIFIIINIVLLSGLGKSLAFSVNDHKITTELALEELKTCNLLPKILKQKKLNDFLPEQILLEANLGEDNYFKNGIKKTFKYSHFYNPLRPLKPELRRRYHADQAVLDYTQNLKLIIAKNKLSTNSQAEVLKYAGMIVHMIQDASSPPHVMWINHGAYDGFENKVEISKTELTNENPNCENINLAGLNLPIEIMKASGLATLQELESPVLYKETYEEDSTQNWFSLPWTMTFFSNGEIFTNQVLNFLSQFNFEKPNLNTPTRNDNNQEGWDQEYLNQGTYGPFSSERISPTIRGDNFGSNSFTVGHRRIQIEPNEYFKLRKNLIKQSILSTERLILWLGVFNNNCKAPGMCL